MIEEVTIQPAFVPKWSQLLNPIWLLQTGNDGWTAPDTNNGSPYLPQHKNQLIRNIFWWFRNPAGNLVGNVLGLGPYVRTIRGESPVMLTTWRDARPPRTGWKVIVTNRVFPFVSYWGGRVEFYWGWRAEGGGFGIKFAIRASAYSDQPN